MKKQVVAIGVGTHIEFWSKDKWKKYNSCENMSAEKHNYTWYITCKSLYKNTEDKRVKKLKNF